MNNLVKFCVKCGSKLDDGDKFCTRCGQKTTNYKKINNINRKEVKQAKKTLKEYYGGLKIKDSYKEKLKSHNISLMDGINIKREIEKEIEAGTVRNEDVENRFNELMIEYEKNKQKRMIENQKRVEEIHEIDIFKKNRSIYVERIIKDSYPNMELESFEKIAINDLKLNGSVSEMKLELNNLSKKIIENHERIGNYDFACSLLEEGGYENRGQFTKHKRVGKKRDLETYVFIKLMDNRIETIASKVYPEIKLFSPTTIQSGDRVIFFNEISNIVFENYQITLNLQNHDKLRLVSRDYSETGKGRQQKFRELLNEKWMKYKENEITISRNEQSESKPTDELMRIAELYEKGLLTEEEFSAMKKKILGL